MNKRREIDEPRPLSRFEDGKELPVTESILAKSREHEHRLIDRARSGDSASARELIDLHKDRLFSFIWRMIHDHHEAEDVCQEAFLKAFASLDSFRPEFRFGTWLFTIGYRVCLNRIRKRRGVASDVDLTLLESPTGLAANDAVESEEAVRLRTVIWSAVEELSPPQRAAILLFYRHDMSCQDISSVIGLPLATVKSHLHRARSRLREMLSDTSAADVQEFRNHSRRSG